MRGCGRWMLVFVCSSACSFFGVRGVPDDSTAHPEPCTESRALPNADTVFTAAAAAAGGFELLVACTSEGCATSKRVEAITFAVTPVIVFAASAIWGHITVSRCQDHMHRND